MKKGVRVTYGLEVLALTVIQQKKFGHHNNAHYQQIDPYKLIFSYM